jgi:hypothetical protein
VVQEETLREAPSSVRDLFLRVAQRESVDISVFGEVLRGQVTFNICLNSLERLISVAFQVLAQLGRQSALQIGVGELEHQSLVPAIMDRGCVVGETVSSIATRHREMRQPSKSYIPVLDGLDRAPHRRHGVTQIGEYLAYALGPKLRCRLLAQGHPEMEDLALKFGLLPFTLVLTSQISQVRPYVAQVVVGSSPTIGGQVTLLQLFRQPEGLIETLLTAQVSRKIREMSYVFKRLIIV